MPDDNPMLPSGATLILNPGSARRSLKSRIMGILREHDHELLDAISLEEKQAARERMTELLLDELP